MAEVLSQALDARAAQISVCVPARVTGYSRTRRLVNAEPVVLRDGEQRPATVETPVVFPGPIYWDVQIGSYGLLIVADEDWRQWFRQGRAADPEAEASHELASAFFLPQVLAEPDQKEDSLADSIVMDAPIATGIVNLGGPNTAGINRAVLHEDMLPDLHDVLVAIAGWSSTPHVDWAAAVVAWNAGPSAIVTAFLLAAAAGNYQAARVLVRPT
jgi:hypothetical protein